MVARHLQPLFSLSDSDSLTANHLLSREIIPCSSKKIPYLGVKPYRRLHIRKICWQNKKPDAITQHGFN
ncbi:hypothetical protein CV016_19455 [Yersinia kristensenii]|uniref:Uncharacterized protein n=1 Tax=Yersinia kristensenii TaxID=28152 RepID=A0AB73NF55_YERKR|nr:hypothetical protein CBW52_22075 [Yersinia kristensenii]OWF78743.1 hypothetical protein B4907_17375 [Yersinia kristensenii]PHZ34201.1 hypothetical protein CS536_19820 [Yersinia kristensenii]PJG61061.1 hypothetical protein CV016_19455 [Yersinia kristensenii]